MISWRLQDQGLHLGAHGEPLHLPGVGDHRPRLAVEPGRRDEVGRQALAQGHRLADVEHVPRLVPEDVAAGGQGGLAHGRAGGPRTPPLQHPRGPRLGRQRRLPSMPPRPTPSSSTPPSTRPSVAPPGGADSGGAVAERGGREVRAPEGPASARSCCSMGGRTGGTGVECTPPSPPRQALPRPAECAPSNTKKAYRRYTGLLDTRYILERKHDHDRGRTRSG